ncbi:glycogen debranching N-terminal domain-containing protein [Micromonospora sp. WMMD1082]|uniref:amylo-alpha-1,6-glucosidase n=1 Tax=Micromonospora sp. WMMD1082 TaxID=3016104 RepID=UPI002417540E|nr:glycogen debranching N-terminal domain-containing protein [Micromonospora sp. WMMD1082]MDG4795706.1 glycogen debranching N-terminal domain-containing protein [Micromonospora sp. WMMD1082]
MPRRSISIFDGNVFMVTDNSGDIDQSPTALTGFFAHDTRFLSTWNLSINGEPLQALSIDDRLNFETRYFLVPGEPTHYVDAKVSVIRQQTVGASLTEHLTVINHCPTSIDLRLRLEVGADFADVTQLGRDVTRQGNHYARVEGERLLLGYRRESFRRESLITSSQPAHVDEHGMTFEIRVEPQQEWSTRLHVATPSLTTFGMLSGQRRMDESITPSRSRQEIVQELDDWLNQAPHLECDYEPLTTAYKRSLVDLAALRYRPVISPELYLPCAGLPRYMTVIQRDFLLSGLQVLPFKPELAATALIGSAVGQGNVLDDFQEEEPGKLGSETRYGEAAAFEELPQILYFGAADVTPLWLVLLDEYERWTGDQTLVRQFEWTARRCLDWIDTYADALGNGYVWYQRRSPAGLANQGWKTSWDAICFQDGRLPDLPRATCEIQGYVYDAKIRVARLARQVWSDPDLADRLEREAAQLKQRFNRDFWIDDKQYYALALDPDGNQVDALASNMGHLLWCGIVPPERAPQLAEHLLGPKLFSGWGIRTLATDAARYNPIGYHTGTIWPFDNAFIAWGLRRYGLADHAGRVTQAILDAAPYFRSRLPEAFAGHDRHLTERPNIYPNACSPHSVSAGAIPLLLRTMLSLNPDGDNLLFDAALPSRIHNIKLLDIPGRWGRTDAFGRSR